MVIGFKAIFNNIQFFCWRLPPTTSQTKLNHIKWYRLHLAISGITAKCMTIIFMQTIHHVVRSLSWYWDGPFKVKFETQQS
jgi:hypothetical protein